MRFARLLPPAAAAALWLCTGTAHAQDPSDLPPSGGSVDALRQGVEQQRPFWRGSGPNRPFMAATIDVGGIFFRPTLQLGIGKPHYRWIGFEGAAAVSQAGGQNYLGLNAVLPGLQARLGARYVFATDQRFLRPSDTFTREDLEPLPDDLGYSRYLNIEVEMSGSVGVPGGNAFASFAGYAIRGVQKNTFLFEETLRIVVDPPYLWRARTGYMFHMGFLGALKVGAAGEVIGVLERETFVVRAGPVVSVSLTHHLEGIAQAMIVAASPDELGLDGADLGQLGLRYSWATGDRWAEFP
jgi:hypothetical protein